MEKLYSAIKIGANADGSFHPEDTYSVSFRKDRGEAVAKARKNAANAVGDTWGVWELTGTVTQPVPELDVTPVK